MKKLVIDRLVHEAQRHAIKDAALTGLQNEVKKGREDLLSANRRLSQFISVVERMTDAVAFIEFKAHSGESIHQDDKDALLMRLFAACGEVSREIDRLKAQ